MNSVFFKKDFYLRFADGKICGFDGIKIFLSVTALLFFATFFVWQRIINGKVLRAEDGAMQETGVLLMKTEPKTLQVIGQELGIVQNLIQKLRLLIL